MHTNGTRFKNLNNKLENFNTRAFAPPLAQSIIISAMHALAPICILLLA